MESRWIAAAKGGDAWAFEQLMAAYEKKIYGLCVRMMGNPQDGEDCAQEAMIRIWQKLSSYRGDSAFSTWVYRVTASLCTDALRKRQRQRQESLEVLAESGFEARDNAPTPEEARETGETREMIAEALSAVPEQMTACFSFGMCTG